MTRKNQRLMALVMAWAGVFFCIIAWHVRMAEHQAMEKAAAIEEQQRQVVQVAAHDALVPEVPNEVDKPPYLGEFRVTVYTPDCDGGRWGYQTATGEASQHLMTCAVDPAVIELDSVLYVGDLQLVAVDTGSDVRGNVADVFFGGSPEKGRRQAVRVRLSLPYRKLLL